MVIDFTGFAGKEITMTNAGPGGVFVGYRNAAGVVTNNPDDTRSASAPRRTRHPPAWS